MQGSELRQLRKGLGMTQEAFAGAIGMSRKAVVEMESGKAPIELRTALAARQLAQPAVGWLPVADIPAALKDGREVLLWAPREGRLPYCIGFYAGGIKAGSDYWLLEGSSVRIEPSHVAALTPPAPLTATSA